MQTPYDGMKGTSPQNKLINITESPVMWKSQRTFKEEKQTKNKQKIKNKTPVNNPLQKYIVAVDKYDLISKW